MAIKKESLNNFLPDGFETLNQEGYKENFSADKISTGYEKDVPDIVSGANLNNLIDVIGKNTNTLNSYVEYLNSLSVNKTPIVDSNNQLNSTQIGLKVYSAAETYLLNDLVTTIQDGKVLFYKSLVASNTGNLLTNTDYWEEVKLGGGSGLEICDIGTALYVDETKGLRRYLNGQIVDINTNTQAFLNRLQQITTLHPSLLCTEEEWQTAKTMSAFGQVGKFVFNYSGNNIVSVRLPRVVNVQGLFDLQNLGMTVAESLPNIKGNTGDVVGDHGGASGAFYVSGNGEAGFNGGYVVWRKLGFDASRSSSAYQDNAPVQQEAIQYPYFIQIATGAETEANIVNTLENVNGFTLLENKYSDKPLYNESWLLSNGQWNAKAVYPTAYEGLQVEYNSEIEAGTTVTLPSGVSYTKRGLSVKLSTETYTDYDFVLNTVDETFRLPLKNGSELIADNSSDKITTQIFNSSHPYTATERVFVTGSALKSGGGGGNFSHVLLNGKVIAREEGDFANFQLILNKGDVLTTTGTASDVNAQINIAPVVGNGSLYYYVGDIDQNHGIVNMGRIGEQLAGKVDTSNTQWATNACMPDYSAGISVTYPLSSNPYTAPCNGMLCPWGRPGDTRIRPIINGVKQEYLILAELSGGSGGYQGRSIYLSKGDVMYFDNSYSVLTGCAFYPLKGAN